VSTTQAVGPRIGLAGKTYLSHTDVRGAVIFSNPWDGDQTSLVQDWIAEFTARYPGVKVENDPGDAASMRARQVTALASGTPPGVMTVRSDSLPYFADRQLLLPLDDLMARDGITSAWFTPNEFPGRTWAGQTYGLPHTTLGDQHLLVVNAELLARIGADPTQSIETWQDLNALVEPARRAGLHVLSPTRVAIGSTAHQLLTYANGGRYWDDDLETITWADDPGVQAAEWLLGFWKAQAGASIQPPRPDDASGPLGIDEWADGKDVCCINEAAWTSEAQQRGRPRLAVYPFPRNAESPGSDGAAPGSGGWSLVIPRNARDQDAAWEWAKLIALSPVACSLAERQRRPSPLAGCNEQAALPTKQPFWSAIATALDKTVPLPIAPIQPQLEQVYRDMQVDLLTEKQPPRDTLELAARDAQKLLDDWRSKRRRP
jgi:ABC-type glycerol-3-phosphate transport system substrate-binding protein